jgi:hypothetical protein
MQSPEWPTTGDAMHTTLGDRCRAIFANNRAPPLVPSERGVY